MLKMVKLRTGLFQPNMITLPKVINSGLQYSMRADHEKLILFIFSCLNLDFNLDLFYRKIRYIYIQRKFGKMKHNLLFFYLLYQLLMRPKSAASKNKRDRYQISSGSSRKKEPSHAAFSSVSRVQSRFSKQPHTWEIKTQKLKVCKDAKSIALIHAYQPKRLKECLVVDPKSYQKFYNNFGQCQLTNLYTKSFIAHFREWRRSLRQRLNNVVSMLVETKSYIQPQQVKMVLFELQGIAQQLKQATEVVFNRKNTQQSNEARQLFENFQHMQQYIHHLSSIVRQLSIYTKQINTLLEQGATKDQEGIRQIQRKVKKTQKQSQKKILQSLHYCTSHPQSTFMNKTQYKIKLKFQQIAKQAISTLQDIFKLSKILERIQQKITQHSPLSHSHLNSNSQVQISNDQLQQIVTIFNGYEEFNIEQGYDEDKITKSHQVTMKLKMKIGDRMREFLEILLKRNQGILNQEYQDVRGQNVVKSVRDFGNRFKICKKKILLLSKIFNKNYYPEYYEKISAFIKQTSQNFQNIGEIIQHLVSKSNDKKYLNRDRAIKAIQSILPSITLYEQNKLKIQSSLSQLLPYAPPQPPSQTPQSQKLQKLLQILTFSQSQTPELLHVPTYPNHSPSSPISSSSVQSLVQGNIQSLYQLMHNNGPFKKMKKQSEQFNLLLGEEIVEKFVGFGEDLRRDSVFMFGIFQGFYDKIYQGMGVQIGKQDKERKINKEVIHKMVLYYEEVMDKCKAYRNFGLAHRFLEWMFQNRIAIQIVNNMKKMQPILNNQLNKDFWSIQDKIKKNPYCYRMNHKVKQFVIQKKQQLEQMTQSASKFIKQKSLFDYYFSQSLKKVKELIENQQLFQKFDKSIETQQLWPSAKFICNWNDKQFNYCIGQQLTPPQIKQYRQQIDLQLANYITKLTTILSSCSALLIFSQKIQKKIQQLKLLLPFCTSSLKNDKKNYKKQQKLQLFNEVSKCMSTYLLNNGIFHIGILTGKQEHIMFINGSQTDVDNEKGEEDFEVIIQKVEKRLKIDIGTLERDWFRSRFVVFNVQNLVKDLIENFKEKPAFFILGEAGGKNQKNFSNVDQQIMPQESINKNQFLDQQIPDDVEDDFIQSKIDQNVSQMIDEIPSSKPNKKSDKAVFILQDQTKYKSNKKTNPNFILANQSLGESTYKIPQSYKQPLYYKINELSSLQKIAQCLTSSKQQQKLIKTSLKIPILSKSLQQAQPNKQLSDYLNTILLQASKNNFLEILNKNNKLSKNQQKIKNLKESLKENLGEKGAGSSEEIKTKRDKREKALTEVLELVNSEFKYEYDGGIGGNQVAIFKDNGKDIFGQVYLNDQSPLKKQKQLVSDSEAMEIQKLFLKSLFTLPYQKNKYLDQIRKNIAQLNYGLDIFYERIKQPLLQFKKYNVSNSLQLSSKIEQYAKVKTKNYQKFTTPSQIDYPSYKKFLQQYQQIQSLSAQPELFILTLNSNPNFPIFLSKSHSNIQSLLQPTSTPSPFPFPSRFFTSTHIQRTFLNSTSINLSRIVTQIKQKQLTNFQPLNSKQIFQILYGDSYREEREKHVERLKEKLKKFWESGDRVDFGIIGNLCDRVGMPEGDEVNARIRVIQGEKQLIEKIAQIQKESATFVLDDHNSTQNQYIEEIDEQPSFILQKQAQKPEIQSYNLEQLDKILKKVQIQHRTLRHKGNVVGLTESKIPAETALKICLNTKDTSCIKYTQKQNKDIDILQLPIFLTTSSKIRQLSTNPQIKKYLQNFTIQINNQNSIQTIMAIQKMKQRPVAVNCSYPRRSIEVKLKRKNVGNGNQGPEGKFVNAKNMEMGSFIMKNYCYGAKYGLIKFQDQIVELCMAQLERIKIQEEQKKKRKEQEQKRRRQEEERKRREEEKRLKQQQQKRIQKQKQQQQQRQKLRRQEQQKQKLQKQRLEREQQQRNAAFLLEQSIIKQSEKNQKQNKKRKLRKNLQIIKNRHKQSQNLILQYNFSEGDQPQQIDCVKMKQDILSTETYDNLSQISFVLSENAAIDREQLIRNNEDYSFKNIQQIIQKSKPKFILNQ